MIWALGIYGLLFLTWLPIGYITARFVRAYRPFRKDKWYWNRPIPRSKPNQKNFFVFLTVGGWASFFGVLFYAILALAGVVFLGFWVLLWNILGIVPRTIGSLLDHGLIPRDPHDTGEDAHHH